MPARSIARNRTFFDSPSGESLIVESDLGDAKHGDQKTNNRAEQGHPLLVLANLRKQVSTIADKEIAGDDIGRTAVNPASNG